MAKKQITQPVTETMLGMIPSGQPRRAPFSRQRAVDQFRSWVYAAVRINAQQVAATPLRLYARKRGGEKLFRTRAVPKMRKAYLLGDTANTPHRNTIAKLLDYGDDFEEVTERHPATELLRKVNPWMGGFDLLTLTVMYAELTGDWYWYPLLSSDGPVELWALPSQWVTIVPSRTDFIEGYAFGRSSQNAVRFGADELLHGKYPNPNDPYYGFGKVEAGWGVVQKVAAMEQMDLATFQNMARPDYAVVVKSGASATQVDAFGKQIREQFEGVKKAGKFVTVTGDISFMPLNFNPKDITGRELSIEEVAAVFGVPVSMLRANEPNLASAQVGFASWRETTILPICRMLEDFLNQQLLPMFGIGDDACFAFDDPVPRNRAEDRLDAESFLRTGQRTLNEQRLINGDEPYAEPMANVPLVNNQPVGYIAPLPSFPPLPQRDERVGDEDDDETPEPVKSLAAAEPAPALAPLPEPQSEVDRVRMLVKAHNEANPSAQVSEAEALAIYDRSLNPTVDDVMAEFLSLVKSSIEDGDEAEFDRLVKEIANAA